jgi:hypothetical protein
MKIKNKNKNVLEFEKNKYTVVKNALSKEIVELATQYALFDEMQDFAPDSYQVVGAHAKYADPVMESLLLKLQPVMEEATGLSLYPTYSFYRVYRNGDTLAKHKDRPSCEISCTLSFNYSYEDSDYSWPIYMNGEAIHLTPGDIAVYRGIENEHWRDPLTFPEPAWHVQAFLHYVDQNGPHAEYKYDKRLSIGELNKNKSVLNKNTQDTKQNNNGKETPSYIEYIS